MRQVSIHENHEFTLALAETINVGGAKSELSWASMQLDLVRVDLLELSHDLLGTIRGVIIDNNDLHVEFTIYRI